MALVTGRSAGAGNRSKRGTVVAVLTIVGLLAIGSPFVPGAVATHVPLVASHETTTMDPRSSTAAPAAVRPLTVSDPLEVAGTVHVGGSPEYAAFDASSNELYVPNWGNNNVSVVSGKTVVATITVGTIPFSATYDPADQDVYVVNEGSNSVSVLSGSTVVGNVHVGTQPQFATYDPVNEELYVDNTGSANVTVINGTTVVATLPVGTDPSRPVVGVASSGGGGGGGGGGGWLPASSVRPSATAPDIFVPNTGSDNVTVFGGTGGITRLGSVHVGSHPQFAAWDPSNVWLYVPNNGSNNVSVLSDVAPFSVLYTVPVGTAPFSASFQPATGHVLVTDFGSNELSVLGGTLVNMVVATVHVGTAPEFVLQDPAVGDLLTPNTGSGNVSVINGTTVVQTLGAGGFPVFGTYDPTNHDLYLQNFRTADLTVLAPVPPTGGQLTFKEVGLSSGATWGATVGTQELNATVPSQGKSTVTFPVANGSVAFTVTPPAGFGVAKVTGKSSPTYSAVNVSGPTLVVVHFGALETITFSEEIAKSWTGLPTGDNWTVTLTPHGKGENPAVLSATNRTTPTGGSVSFVLPKGSHYLFLVTKRPDYKAAPFKGALGVPAKPLTKNLKFKPITGAVKFTESGLSKGTLWFLNITGPMNVSLSTSGPVLKVALVNGTYSYSAQAKGGPVTAGTFTVTAPSPQTISLVLTPTHPTTNAGLMGPVGLGAAFPARPES